MALTQIPSGMIAPAQTLSLNGVTFPATAVPSADANTLDDYEEGTFTPTFVPETNSFGAISYQNQSAFYTKIGRLCFVGIRLRTASLTIGSATGQLSIGGLPFTVINDSSNGRNAIAVSNCSTWSTTPLTGYAENGTTNITLSFRTASNGADSLMQVSGMSTSATANSIFVSAVYVVA